MITTNELRTTWRGKDRWLSDGGARGAGRLVARITRDGVAFLYQYFGPEGRKRFFPLGPYDAQDVRGMSLRKARDRAAELSTLYRRGILDLHAHFEQQRAELERVRRVEEEAARRAQDEAQRGTLEQLMNAYTAHLKRLGKKSVGDVKNIFKNHIVDAAPDLVRRKAAEISVDDFVDLIGQVVEAGKGRTAAKLRSYLRAAYSIAIRSRTDPAAPLIMKTFGIVANPIASIGALSQFSRARARNLSGPELAAFLKRLDALTKGSKKDALELCLLLGGQRPTQLLRARQLDVDLPAGLITLYDPKGARTQPRPHVIPLTNKAVAILERRLDEIRDAGDVPLFSTNGRTAMRLETISALVTDISAEMVKVREARDAFQLRDLRRTVETMFASLGTSKDVRAQVQSHGLGGVQQRHYDRHEYMREKRAALELWASRLGELRSGMMLTSETLASGMVQQSAQEEMAAAAGRVRISVFEAG